MKSRFEIDFKKSLKNLLVFAKSVSIVMKLISKSNFIVSDFFLLEKEF